MGTDYNVKCTGPSFSLDQFSKTLGGDDTLEKQAVLALTETYFAMADTNCKFR